MGKINHIDFYGLKVSLFEDDDLESLIVNSINNKQKKVLFGYSLGTFPYFRKHPEIAVYSNQFDVVVTDGRGFYLLTKLFGVPVKSDLSIPNMSKLSLEIANKNKFSVMLIGSSPKNNSQATLNIRKNYPHAIIYDGYDGGLFTHEDQLMTIEKINKVKPDILLIGVSSPKKEAFAANWKEKLEVKIIIPFGGAIDIFSGKSKPIPKLYKKLLLGALFRWYQEPKRLFRDSIIYTASVLFKLIPALVFNSVILRKRNFSIPGYYHKGIIAPINGIEDGST